MNRLRMIGILGAWSIGSLAVAADAPPAPVAAAMKEISPAAIAAHVKFLSDDLLEGRGPGTRGDELARLYIASQFESYGLQPAGENGSFNQPVPLIGLFTVPESTKLSFQKDGQTRPLTLLDEFVGTNETQTESVAINSELIFVGHGVIAPEYKWDDYKGTDVRGKVLVMLVDDPPATSGEPDLFKGKARTYYGRWTYKYEKALELGAAGAILIHTDDSAGYPWDVVRNSWGRERAYVKLPAGASGLKLTSWMTQATAE